MLTPFNVSNIVLYRITSDIDLTNLEELAKKRVFTPCGPHDVSKTGWVPPMGDEFEAFTHHANGLVLLSYKTEKKNIPASTLKEYVDEKVHDQEQKLNRKLKKTEIATIKDNIKHELLPKTLPKATRTFIWLDVKAKLVMVNSSSPRAAENVTALLRGTIGSFPCVPVQLNSPVNVSLTNWVKTGDLPDGLSLGSQATLKSVDDELAAVASVRNQDLMSEEVAGHIETGKLVTKMAIVWQERVSFIITEDFVLNRIRFSEELTAQNEDISKEDFAQRFDADFVLYTGELMDLIGTLIVSCGGESEEASQPIEGTQTEDSQPSLENNEIE